MTGVTLNEKHCTRDLGLYLTDAVIAAPEVQTSYALVPSRDGYLDLSTALDGEIHYKGREIKLSFGDLSGALPERTGRSCWRSSIELGARPESQALL